MGQFGRGIFERQLELRCSISRASWEGRLETIMFNFTKEYLMKHKLKQDF